MASPNNLPEETASPSSRTKKGPVLSDLNPKPRFHVRTPEYVELGMVMSIDRDQRLFDLFLALGSGCFGALLTNFQWWIVINTVIFLSLTGYFHYRISKTKKEMLSPEDMVRFDKKE